MNVKINKFCKFTNHLSKQHSMNIPTNYSGEYLASGNRDKYSFTMAILDGSKSFKSYAAGKTIKISLTSDFNLVVAYI